MLCWRVSSKIKYRLMVHDLHINVHSCHVCVIIKEYNLELMIVFRLWVAYGCVYTVDILINLLEAWSLKQ